MTVQQNQSSTNLVLTSGTASEKKTNIMQVSQQKPKQNTKHTSGQKKETRNEKRRRWAKQNKPAPRPIVQQKPSRKYTSVCCGAPAIKPKAGEKQVAKDPESGKMKSEPKGLGHWRCNLCKKPCKVTVGKPKEANV